MKEKLNVYLAGGINKLSYEQAFGWRIKVTKELLKYGINCLNPIASKDFDKFNSGGKFTEGDKVCYWRDLFLVKQSDIVLMNLNNGQSTGTMIEKGWCDVLGKLVVVVSEEPIKHPFVYEKAIIFKTIDDAIEFIKELGNKNE